MYRQMHKLEPGQPVLLSSFCWIGSKIAHFCSSLIIRMLASCLELQYHVVLSFSQPFLFFISLLRLNFRVYTYQIQHQSSEPNNLVCASLKSLNYNL